MFLGSSVFLVSNVGTREVGIINDDTGNTELTDSRGTVFTLGELNEALVSDVMVRVSENIDLLDVSELLEVLGDHIFSSVIGNTLENEGTLTFIRAEVHHALVSEAHSSEVGNWSGQDFVHHFCFEL